MDVSKQLQAYEVEYHVLQDELLDAPPTLNQHQRAAQLERTNQSLRQQNLDLLEELQVQTDTHVKKKTSSIILCLCSYQPSLFLEGVARSYRRPGESGGDSGSVREPAEGAGFYSGG